MLGLFLPCVVASDQKYMVTSLMRNTTHQDPTVDLCLGPFGGSRRGCGLL